MTAQGNADMRLYDDVDRSGAERISRSLLMVDNLFLGLTCSAVNLKNAIKGLCLQLLSIYTYGFQRTERKPSEEPSDV